MPLALLCTAQFVVVLDVTVVAIALPVLQADLHVSETGARLGDHGVHARVRRLPALRGPARRPGGAAAGVHDRPDPLRVRFARRRARPRRGGAARRPRAAGAGRRDDRPERPRAADRERRRREPPPRARLVDRRRGRRRRQRLGARRRAERAARLARGVPRERSRLPRRGGARAAAPAGAARRGRAGVRGPRRGGHGDGGADRARARPHGPSRGAGRGVRAARGVRPYRAARGRPAARPRGPEATGRRPARTSSRSR